MCQVLIRGCVARQQISFPPRFLINHSGDGAPYLHMLTCRHNPHAHVDAEDSPDCSACYHSENAQQLITHRPAAFVLQLYPVQVPARACPLSIMPNRQLHRLLQV